MGQREHLCLFPSFHNQTRLMLQVGGLVIGIGHAELGNTGNHNVNWQQRKKIRWWPPSGTADRRTSKPSNQQTSGPSSQLMTNKRTIEPPDDKQGLPNQQTSGPSNQQTSGPSDDKQADHRTSKQAGHRTSKHMDYRITRWQTSGLPNQQTSENHQPNESKVSPLINFTLSIVHCPIYIPPCSGCACAALYGTFALSKWLLDASLPSNLVLSISNI